MQFITVPGKVLFYGGYSVLLEGHTSLSIAVVDKQKKGVTASYRLGQRRIVSKQFDIDKEPTLKDLENKELVVFAYIVTETYLKSYGLWHDVEVHLENSPIFGSKGEKSGLGSSAASTVAVVKALFEANGLDTNAHTETILKLSQFAYAMYAQKIGSGFDIATASVGKSIIYNRYNPNELVLPSNTSEKEIIRALKLSTNKPWTWLKAIPVNVPAQLLVFNVKSASTSTISAVKAWKQWKAKNNEEFIELMNKQDEVERKAINALLNKDWENTRIYTHKAREIHRKMQESIAKIVKNFDPVEPPQFTEIIDEAERIDGVIAGRCPGAGGWDSIAFLTTQTANKEIVYPKIIKIAKEKGIKLDYVDVKVL